jgi:ComF family protein
LSNNAKRLLDKLNAGLGRLLASSCLLCAAPAGRRSLCSECLEDLPWLDAAVCSVCAHPLPEPGLCGRCVAEPPHFDHVIAACRYAFPLDGLIQSYKYGGRLAAGPALAALLAPRIRTRPDLVLPIPLSTQRLRERGFNQAFELARIIGKELNAPVDANLCIKTRDTAPQTHLPWKARRKNIKGAFVVLGNLDGRHVAVVDDVLTTGATLSELARNLKRAGAASVTGYVVARTAGR